MQTRITKGDNGYKAITDHDLPNGMTLRVSTRKGNTYLTTTASCHKKDGHFETHRLYQDYHKTIEKLSARCTEKTIRTMHERALQDFDLIVQDALNHYNTPEYLAKHGKETA
jgi:hypothetical protein